MADGKMGDPSIRKVVEKIKPKLVVSGHIHEAHAVVVGEGELEGVIVVNAAMCQKGYAIGWEAVVVSHLSYSPSLVVSHRLSFLFAVVLVVFVSPSPSPS